MTPRVTWSESCCRGSVETIRNSVMEGNPLVVVLVMDVARVLTTPEEVNKALRTLIDAMPAKTRRSTGARER
jgi:hypothetical protein